MQTFEGLSYSHDIADRSHNSKTVYESAAVNSWSDQLEEIQI